MTIIAWDGKTLVADKQSTSIGYASTVTKIFLVPNGVVAFTGDLGRAGLILNWFLNGRCTDKWPKLDNSADGVQSIFATGNKLFVYDESSLGFGFQIEDKFAAWGHGRDYALAAMHLGKSAIEAVEIACILDLHCGKGIDYFERTEFKD